MTGDQVKAYMFLLCESWLEIPRATLPNDLKQLSVMAQMSADEFMNNWDKIMNTNFILGSDNRFYNPRLKRISDMQQTNYENGKKGGRPVKLNQK